MRIQYNKVTPVSKTVALILFIVLPFIFFFMGVEYGKALGVIKYQDRRIDRIEPLTR